MPRRRRRLAPLGALRCSASPSQGTIGVAMEPKEIVRAYDRRDVQAMISGLRCGDPEGRPLAARYLGKLQATDAVTALQDALADANHATRSMALHALSEIGDESAIQVLIGALARVDLPERSQAATRLGKLRATEAVPALLDCLDAKDGPLQSSTLVALGQIGDARAAPKIAELAEDAPSLGVSVLATKALVELGDARAIPQVISLATETERHVAGGRWTTYMPEAPFQPAWRRERTIRWWIRQWAADTLVELRVGDAAPPVAAAARTAVTA